MTVSCKNLSEVRARELGQSEAQRVKLLSMSEKGQCPEERSGQEQNTSFRQVARKQAEKSLPWDKWTCPHDSPIWNDKGSQGRAICPLSWF